jgi:hypothetical protein
MGCDVRSRICYPATVKSEENFIDHHYRLLESLYIPRLRCHITRRRLPYNCRWPVGAPSSHHVPVPRVDGRRYSLPLYIRGRGQAILVPSPDEISSPVVVVSHPGPTPHGVTRTRSALKRRPEVQDPSRFGLDVVSSDWPVWAVSTLVQKAGVTHLCPPTGALPRGLETVLLHGNGRFETDAAGQCFCIHRWIALGKWCTETLDIVGILDWNVSPSLSWCLLGIINNIQGWGWVFVSIQVGRPILHSAS